MNEQCLMIRLKNNKRFFTYEKNLPHLVEFSKTFGAEISIVKIKDANPEILELNELAPAICNASYKAKSNYEVISTNIASFTRLKPQRSDSKRNQILALAAKVQDYILKELMEDKILTIRSLQSEFSNLHISTLCNHVKRAIEELKGKNYNIIRVGKGKYQLKE